MTRFNQSYFDRVTRFVEEAEAKTSAELLVAIHPESGRYRDVDYLFGALLALAGLLFIVFNPWTLHWVYMLPLEASAFFIIGVLCCFAVPPLRRLLSTKRRRQLQVRGAAAALFVEQGVANTRARTGVLVYLSLLEKQVEVIADLGIKNGVKPDVWSECVFELKKIGSARDCGQALLEGIRRLGDVLSDCLPPGEDNPDEIPNRPRTKQ